MKLNTIKGTCVRVKGNMSKCVNENVTKKKCLRMNSKEEKCVRTIIMEQCV